MLNKTILALIAAIWISPSTYSSGDDDSLAHLRVTVLDDETGEPTPVRVRMTDQNGSILQAPDAAVAVMYGRFDRAEGYEFQPDSSFYIAGKFDIDLPPGEYTLELSKGNEYLKQHHTITLKPNDSVTVSYEMERWANSEARGWYSADNHIHIRRSPRKGSLILNWVKAEGLNVGVLMWMGDFWQTFYAQYAFGRAGVYQRDNTFLTSGQEEPRTPELGHAGGFGAEEKVRYRDEYYYYDKVFKRIRELGGLTAYIHQAETFGGYRGLTLDGLHGRVDMLEILQFCAPGGPLKVDHYYHMLELGFKITAIAGSDFPWCGLGRHYGFDEGPDSHFEATQVGNVRFHTYAGDDFSYESWRNAVRAGRTFVSSGPLIEFTVNEELPGEEINVSRGSTLEVTARAYGHNEQVPLEKLEIVSHGETIVSEEAHASGQSPAEITIN